MPSRFSKILFSREAAVSYVCKSQVSPVIWFGYLHELHDFILFVLRCLNDGVCDWYIDALLMGEGMAYDGLPFPDTGCPVPDVGYIYIVWNY